jgi:Macrocin-O-methyltransferase (TylF)
MSAKAIQDLDQFKLELIGMADGNPTRMKPGEEDRSRESMTVEPADLQRRLEGHDWPADGLSMVGVKRLDNVQMCIERVLADGVPGDFIETGVWRGGTTIFMRAVLKAHAATDRTVFVADSFEGLPEPDPETYPVDRGCRLHEFDYLAVSVDEVKENFARYDLLDDQVRFVKGWFRDTMPTLAGHQWAIVRLDGDMYESTMTVLENLYPDLVPGGFLIVDDYRIKRCARAVDDFRAAHGITEDMVQIDWTGMYWRKSGDPGTV